MANLLLINLLLIIKEDFDFEGNSSFIFFYSQGISNIKILKLYLKIQSI
jgi:hypothetical protein